MGAGFCCFFQGSPDLRAAKEVADYLKTKHHEFTFTVQVLQFSQTQMHVHRSVLDYFLNFFVMTFGALTAFLSHFVVSK
jgi:asparagine synthetase B (glutamine-hydrolysing)